MLSFEEFKNFFEKKGRFPNSAYVSKKGYNEAQFKTKYKTYLKSENKKQEKFNKDQTDDKWEITKNIVDRRDRRKCQFYRILTISERKAIESELIGVAKKVDRAHIFGKGSNPHMKYNSSNVITIYHIFHQRLDTYRHPLYDTPIDSEERDEIWSRIIGVYNFEQLKKQSIV